jgi:hypothetical protein
MSALPPKADIAERECHVRFVPKADIGALFDRFVGSELTTTSRLSGSAP